MAESDTDVYRCDWRKEGESQVCEFPAQLVVLRFSRLSFHDDSLRGWLDVQSRWPTGPQRVYSGVFNVSGPRARTDMAKYLRERCPDVSDWTELLELSSMRVIHALQEGSPTYRMGQVERREHGRFRIEPIAFEKLPVIWFGRGGSGKSLVALAAAAGVHANIDIIGLPLLTGPVLYCDWELDEVTMQSQLELLSAGHQMDIPDIHYRPCLSPLYQEAESIARYIDREGIELVVVDSLGFACGGDKNSQEVAMRMFGAMRPWRVAVICIDHMAKGEDANTPYGSAYFENSVRATWRVKGQMEAHDLHVSMSIEKTNLGKYPPVGFRFRFDDVANPSYVTCEPEDVREMPEEIRGEKLNQSIRVKTAIVEAGVAMTVGDIASATGVPLRSVRTVCDRLVESGDLTKVLIRGGSNKYALREWRWYGDKTGDEQK